MAMLPMKTVVPHGTSEAWTPSKLRSQVFEETIQQKTETKQTMKGSLTPTTQLVGLMPQTVAENELQKLMTTCSLFQ